MQFLDYSNFHEPNEREKLHINRCIEFKYRDIIETRALVLSVIVASIVFTLLVTTHVFIVGNYRPIAGYMCKTLLCVQVVSGVLVLLSLLKLILVVKSLERGEIVVSVITCEELLNLCKHRVNGRLLVKCAGKTIKSPFIVSGEERERLRDFQNVRVLLVLTKNKRVGVLTLMPNGSEWRDIGESDLMYSSRNKALAFSSYDFTMLGSGRLLDLRSFREPTEEEGKASKRIVSKKLGFGVLSFIFWAAFLAMFILGSIIDVKTSQNETPLEVFANYATIGVALLFVALRFFVSVYRLIKIFKLYRDVLNDKAMVIYSNELSFEVVSRDTSSNLFATDGSRLIRTKFKWEAWLRCSDDDEDDAKAQEKKVLLIAKNNLRDGIIVEIDKEITDKLNNGEEDTVYTDFSDEAFETLCIAPKHGYST